MQKKGKQTGMPATSGPSAGNKESCSKDTSNSRDSTDGRQQKKRKNRQRQGCSRNTIAASSSTDAFTASGTPATIATTAMSWPTSREVSHSEKASKKHRNLESQPKWRNNAQKG